MSVAAATSGPAEDPHLGVARLALANYDLPTTTALWLVNLSENATYRADTADGRSFALRVHRAGYHSKVEIESELAWMTALRREGVVITPQPVAGQDGAFIQTVSPPGGGQAHHVVLTVWERGEEPGIHSDLIKPFTQLGQISALMHQHVRRWQRPAFFQRFTWDFDTCLGDVAPHWGRWRDGFGVTGEVERLLQRTVDVIGGRLAAYGKSPARFGLVHGDTRLANLLVDGEQIKVLDFDDCGFGWFMYDAATPVSFHEHEAKVPELTAAWTEGYRKVAPLAAADENEIATFIMLRRLLLVAWVSSHREAPLPQALGLGFTQSTLPLCEAYLSAHA
jgi:Ser/Thr protein kinase RdoA (MazF antagonist)